MNRIHVQHDVETAHITDDEAFDMQAYEYVVGRNGFEICLHGGFRVRDVETGINFVADTNESMVALARYLDRRGRRPLDEIGRPDIDAFTLRGDWIKCHEGDWMDFHVSPRNGDVLMISDRFDVRKRIASEIRYYRKRMHSPWTREWHHVIVTICLFQPTHPAGVRQESPTS